ncbi:MAG: ATP-binding protein [Cyanobacteria bacterium P01_G01_bin.54]
MQRKYRLAHYHQLPLAFKLSLPFIVVFTVLWVIGSVLVGQYFANKLEKQQQQAAAELATLLQREVRLKQQGLQQSARLVANNQKIINALVQENSIGLRQEILPIRAILDADQMTVINTKRQALLDSHSHNLKLGQIDDRVVRELLVKGVDLATIVSSKNSGPPVLLGTAPLKDTQAIVGGLILGEVLSDTLLMQITESIGGQVLVLSDQGVVASTFPTDLAREVITELKQHNTLNITIADEPFTVQSIQLNGLKQQSFDLIFLISRQSLVQAKSTLWLVTLGIGLFGSVLIIGLGIWLAKRVTQPIQQVTDIAQQVVNEQDFSLRATVASQDEAGKLAQALNQLIRWSGQYTESLELTTQTLETRVEERTKEVSEALQNLKATQSQLIQTEKMSSLGEMVAGIAHEINNPLSFIQGNLNPLKQYFEDLSDLIAIYQVEYPEPTDAVLDKQEEIELEFLTDDLNKLLQSMEVGTKRVRDIVVSLRNYSRLDEAVIKDSNIQEGLDNTLLILNHRLRHNIEVIKKYYPLPLIRFSPAQINQVFTNIIVNAIDAMENDTIDAKRLVITTSVTKTGDARISIQDNGPGMTSEVQAKIFDPFFTTKPVGKGTGLGLGICFKIIEQHQGSLDVLSEVGQGTEFIIQLPQNADLLKDAAAQLSS